MFSKKNFKNTLSAIIGIIVMCACTLAVILYAEGYYDISFIQRPADAKILFLL